MKSNLKGNGITKVENKKSKLFLYWKLLLFNNLTEHHLSIPVILA